MISSQIGPLLPPSVLCSLCIIALARLLSKSCLTRYLEITLWSTVAFNYHGLTVFSLLMVLKSKRRVEGVYSTYHLAERFVVPVPSKLLLHYQLSCPQLQLLPLSYSPCRIITRVCVCLQ